MNIIKLYQLISFVLGAILLLALLAHAEEVEEINNSSWLAVIGSFSSLEDAEEFANGSILENHQINIYRSSENEFAITLGAEHNLNQAERLVTRAKTEGFGADYSYVWPSYDWEVINRINEGAIELELTQVLRDNSIDQYLNNDIPGKRSQAYLDYISYNPASGEFYATVKGNVQYSRKINGTEIPSLNESFIVGFKGRQLDINTRNSKCVSGYSTPNIRLDVFDSSYIMNSESISTDAYLIAVSYIANGIPEGLAEGLLVASEDINALVTQRSPLAEASQKFTGCLEWEIVYPSSSTANRLTE